jgi:hypothetical protein
MAGTIRMKLESALEAFLIGVLITVIFLLIIRKANKSEVEDLKGKVIELEYQIRNINKKFRE